MSDAIPGYGRSGGSKTTAAELNSIFESMEQNELLMPTRLLTGTSIEILRAYHAPIYALSGYIPGAEALSAVEKLATKLKHARPSLTYLLDRKLLASQSMLLNSQCATAVMGDAGRLYVAADVIPVYREMLPLATIITPNWFEAE